VHESMHIRQQHMLMQSKVALAAGTCCTARTCLLLHAQNHLQDSKSCGVCHTLTRPACLPAW
jgi:hypothetical protein